MLPPIQLNVRGKGRRESTEPSSHASTMMVASPNRAFVNQKVLQRAVIELCNRIFTQP